MLGKILAIAAAGLLIWFLVNYIRQNPQLMTGENMNKSFLTMGVLAIFLMAFIGICILLLKS